MAGFGRWLTLYAGLYGACFADVIEAVLGD